MQAFVLDSFATPTFAAATATSCRAHDGESKENGCFAPILLVPDSAASALKPYHRPSKHHEMRGGLARWRLLVLVLGCTCGKWRSLQDILAAGNGFRPARIAAEI